MPSKVKPIPAPDQPTHCLCGAPLGEWLPGPTPEERIGEDLGFWKVESRVETEEG